MNISIIGTGYVGLVTGVCLSDKSNHVICVDNNSAKVESMKSGHVPIYEPGLKSIMERNAKNGNLEFTMDLSYAVENSEIIFLALPTPPGEDGSADLSYIFNVVCKLAKLITSYRTIVVKSTVPVGTGDKIEEYLLKHLDASLFDVVSNPEFLREGAAVHDFMNPDRIIIGTESERAVEAMKKLYSSYKNPYNKILSMDRRSSELSKYASNCFLATKISFMNEMATLCDKLGANVDHIKEGMGSDHRISEKFLNSGIGYGGSCFPKDVKALIQTAKDNYYIPKLLVASEKVNKEQKTLLVRMLDEHFRGHLEGKTIAIWGGAFKPNTDDIREAPALEIINDLLDRGAHVKLFDPVAMDNIQEIYGDKISFGQDKYDILPDADALLLTTEWHDFKDANVALIQSKMAYPLVLDGRNFLDEKEFKSHGFIYKSIGRPSIRQHADASIKRHEALDRVYC